jgi:hypothetical protein
MQDRKFEFATQQSGDWHDPSPKVNYQSQWQAFALRRNLALILLYGWLPACFAFYVVAGDPPERQIIAFIGMFLWLAAALTAIWWAGEFRCPRCRRRYAALGNARGDTNLTRGIFSKVCTNCKLSKFEIVQDGR